MNPVIHGLLTIENNISISSLVYSRDHLDKYTIQEASTTKERNGWDDTRGPVLKNLDVYFTKSESSRGDIHFKRPFEL